MSDTKSGIQLKQSDIPWCGHIPNEWNVYPMRKIFDTKKELNGLTNDEHTLLRLSINGVEPRDENSSGKNPENYNAYQVFYPDDLVMCLFDYDVTPRTVGYVKEEGILTGAYTRLIPKDDVDSRYYYYYFLYLDQKKELLHLCTGLRNSLSKYVFWPLKTPVPPYRVQKQIADFLDEKTANIDKIISQKQKLIDSQRELINSLVLGNHLESDENRTFWENINAEWQIENARWLFNEINIRNRPEEEPLAVTQDRGVLPKSLCSEQFVSPSNYESLKYVDINDFVISLRSFEGGVEISKYKGLVSPAYTVLRLCPRYNNHYYQSYYKYLLKTPQFVELLNTIIMGIRDGKNINFRDFRNLPLPVPTEESVGKLLMEFDKYENLVIYFQKEKKLLHEYRESLIYNAVTGKIKV